MAEARGGFIIILKFTGFFIEKNKLLIKLIVYKEK
jgi:hypothetical protein